MTRIQRISVGALALFLALVVACDESSTPPVTPGTPGEDPVPPRAVDDLALSYEPGVNSVAFDWTAPRDDTAHDRVARYDIRYSYSFPLDWDRSIRFADPPDPLPVGTPQQAILADPVRGRDIYAAIRSYDEAGNESASSPVAHVHVPGVSVEVTCSDVLSGGPIPGLDVLITSRSSWERITDAEGRVTLPDISEGTMGLEVTRGTSVTPYHGFADAFAVSTNVTRDVPMIEYAPTDSPYYESRLDLLLDSLIPGGTSKVLRKWSSYPIPFYAPAFVNQYGLDYRDLVRRAAARWNLRVGQTIFVETSSAPAKGVTMLFLPRSTMGIQNAYTSYSSDADGYPLLDTIRVLDEFSDEEKLYRIMMHELGHTIRLAHLADPAYIMMGGQPLPPDISDDEVRLVQTLLALPNGIDLSHYDPAPPPPAASPTP